MAENERIEVTNEMWATFKLSRRTARFGFENVSPDIALGVLQGKSLGTLRLKTGKYLSDNHLVRGHLRCTVWTSEFRTIYGAKLWALSNISS
ncbi:unnamed protein product [Calypogeia fissa]